MSIEDMPPGVLLEIAGASSAADMFLLVQSWKGLWENTNLKRLLLRRAFECRLDICLRAAKPMYHSTKYHRERWSLQVEDIFPTVADSALPPQVLVAGSVTVASALGQVWTGGDVDIFCTWFAAPAVRQRLIQRCNLMCSGGNDTYGPAISIASEIVEDNPSDTAMDHVEGYAPRPAEGSDHLKSWRVGGSYLMTPEEFYKQACTYGHEAVNPTKEQLRLRGPSMKRIGLPGGCLDGDFPYNFDLEHETFVQLIVGKENCNDARELLSSFDLAICQTYFDGQNFHIPSPRQTLCGKTSCLAPRHALLTEYFRTLANQALEAEGKYIYLNIIPAMDEAVWAGVGIETAEDARSVMNRNSFVMTLILRMQKYYRRGVQIIDVPTDRRINQHALNFQSYDMNGVGDFMPGLEPPMGPDQEPPPPPWWMAASRLDGDVWRQACLRLQMRSDRLGYLNYNQAFVPLCDLCGASHVNPETQLFQCECDACGQGLLAPGSRQRCSSVCGNCAHDVLLQSFDESDELLLCSDCESDL